MDTSSSNGIASSNSDAHTTNAGGGGGSGSAALTSTKYEMYINKLTHILLYKARDKSDKLAQLEELWNSLSESRQQSTTTTEANASTAASKQQLQQPAKTKRDPTDSTQQISTHVPPKKLKLANNNNNNTTSSRSLAVSPSSNSNHSDSSSSSSSSSSYSGSSDHSASSLKVSVLHKANRTSSAMDIAATANSDNSRSSSVDCDMSSTATESASAAAAACVVNMLELSCVVCAQFSQESNNKLVECRQCSRLYHQLCHAPAIDKQDLESDPSSSSSNNDTLDLYLPQCSACKVACAKNSPAATRNGATARSPTYDAAATASANKIAFKRTSNTLPLPKQQNISTASTATSIRPTVAVANSVGIGSNSSKPTIGNGQSSSSSTASGMKGFAALATKLNGQSPRPSMSTSGSTALNGNHPVKSNKNPDELFKQFRQSAATTATAHASDSAWTNNNRPSSMNGQASRSIQSSSSIPMQMNKKLLVGSSVTSATNNASHKPLTTASNPFQSR